MTDGSHIWILEGGRTIEMRNEPAFALAGGPLSFPYPRVYPEHIEHRASACHGLILWNDSGMATASVALRADGGASGVHDRSLCVLGDRCFVAIGPSIVSLSLPGLELLWSTQVDPATCFGVHPTRDGMAVVSHGELEVACIGLSGDVIWATSGADIFTGVRRITDSEVHVEDFYDNRYVLDLRTGATISFVSSPGCGAV